MDWVLLLLLPSTSVPCSWDAAATAAAAAADDDYVDEYDLAPIASFFIEFRNQFLSYQLVP